MQFGGAFWATLQRFQMNSHAIDQLLSKEETTLEDVLNDENVIQETKNQNQKLIEFLNPSRLEKLIEYVTVFPSENDDKKRTQNHPFIACEMLSEPGPLHDKILEIPALIEKLFHFLNESVLNPTLAGYFGKVVYSLINRNSEKVFVYLNQNLLLQKMVNHIYNKSIVDILLKLIIFENLQNDNFLEERKNIFGMIFTSLQHAEEYNVFFAAYIINEVLYKQNEVNSWRDIISILFYKENLQSLFKLLSQDSTFKIVAASSLLKTILNTLRNDSFDHHDFYDLLIESLPVLKKKLESSSGLFLQGTFNETFESLGEYRLRIIDLITTSIKIDSGEFNLKLDESGVISEITRLFFGMPWNSMLHNSFEVFINSILNSRSELLIHSLLIKAEFLSQLVTVGLSSVSSVHRPGYLGHITKIGNFLNTTEIASVKDCIKLYEKWETFTKEYLVIRTSLDSRQLGENNKIKESESSGSEQDDELSLPKDIKQKDFLTSNKFQNNDNDDENKPEEEPDFEEEEKIEPAEEIKEQVFTKTEKLIIQEVPKEIVSESIRVLEEVGKSESPERIAQNSPKNRRLSFELKTNSPNLNPEYTTVNFWSIELRVDELGPLE